MRVLWPRLLRAAATSYRFPLVEYRDDEKAADASVALAVAGTSYTQFSLDSLHRKVSQLD